VWYSRSRTLSLRLFWPYHYFKISILTFFSRMLSFFLVSHGSDTCLSSKGFKKKKHALVFRFLVPLLFFRRAITVQCLFVSVGYCFFTRRGQASRWQGIRRGYLASLRLSSAFYTPGVRGKKRSVEWTVTKMWKPPREEPAVL